jgi:hypothetical protein
LLASAGGVESKDSDDQDELSNLMIYLNEVVEGSSRSAAIGESSLGWFLLDGYLVIWAILNLKTLRIVRHLGYLL